MNWPLPKDFSDALRKPPVAFADPDLAAGDTVVGLDGRPLPRRGDAAEVYQVCAEDDRSWAVKCFTRPVRGLADRYARLREAIDPAALPFAVRFDYLPEGVRVGGHSWPVLKMDWVEGLLLHRAAGQHVGNPTALEGIFRCWVQLARQLRAAGIAHADLQHGNVILVPGGSPGSFSIKLIDYDGMYVPALANHPSGEVGHPNYQHPARVPTRAYTAGLDRFPLLVIGTALKGLSLLGRGLWERYDTGDNLLFTRDDFHNPAGSALLRELCQTGDPVVRALVGHLTLACRNPISVTPWLDELVGEDGRAQLPPEQSRAVVRALGLGPKNGEPVDAIPLEPEPLDAEVMDAEPVDVLPLPEEEPEVERPRPRKKRPKPLPARPFPLVPAAIVAGLLMIAGAAVAGALTADDPKPDETAQANPNDPAPPPPPASPVSGGDTPPAKPAPATPPKPEIVPPAPPVPPAFAGPPGFHRVWGKPVADQRGFTRVYFAHDGRWVFTTEAGSRVAVFDAKTGAAGPVLREPGLPTVPIGIWTLDRDRVAVYGLPPKGPGLWDVRTGDPLPGLPGSDLVLPPRVPGVTGNAPECQVSADARYVFAGYHGFVRGQAFDPAPYRVVDTTTGRVVVRGDWQSGGVRFTADGSRMLMAETNGRVRWVKLPGGEEEIAWAFQPNLFSRTIAGMSADGSLVLFVGKPPGLTSGQYLLDGKTGQVLRKLDFSFSPDRTVLSADGRWVAGVVYEPGARKFSAVVADARTGAELVRTPIDGNPNDIRQAAFTPDGKAFVLHHRGDRELLVYELRGDVPPVPAGTPVPPPLGPVPARLPPGAMIAAAPQVRPVPPVIPAPPPVFPRPLVPPAPVLPDPPAIKPRLTVVTDAGVMANQLPQAPLYTRDGKTIILSGGQAGTILMFNAKTGAAGPVCEAVKGAGGIHWLAPVGNDRIASYGFDGKHATWDIKTGKRVAEDQEVRFPQLPPMPVGALGHAGLTFAVSPSGRYIAVGRKESIRPLVPGPLRVLDATTGKVVVKAGWNASQGRGFVGFTADESRLLLIDGLGKAAWYKLPSGEPDGEWRTGNGQPDEFIRVLGMSADGRALLYYGPMAGQRFGVYLLDGKTGQVVRQLVGAPQLWSALSPDGRFAVLMGTDPRRAAAGSYLDVSEAATGRLVGRLTLPEKAGRGSPEIGFSPDGKEVAVYYPAAKELSVFPLPGGGAQLVGPPAPPDMRRPQPPAPAGPPELKTRWAVPTGPNRMGSVLQYEPVSGKVVLTDPAARSAVVYDGRTGQLVADQPEGVRWAGGDLLPLPGGKIGFHYRADAAISVWNLKVGKLGDPIPVPDIPPGPDRTNHRFVRASPDGKFLAVARYGTPKAAAPLRVFDAKTGKAVVSADWTGGSVYFTADASRVLVAEAGGRCRWFKLPSGEPDGEWNLAPAGVGLPPRVTDISADGTRVGYNGPRLPGGTGVAVLDGKTGKLVRAFGDEYLISSPVSLSADGRLAAAIRRPGDGGNSFGIDVVEVDTGRIVGRATVPTGGGIVPHFFLTPDGKALLVHNSAAGKVHWFDLPANPDIVPPNGAEPNRRPPPRVNPPARPGIGLKPVQLAPRWVAHPTSGDTVSNLHYDPDARLVLLSNPITRRNCVVDAGTGNEQPDRIAGLKDVAGGDLFPLARGRVGVFNRQDESITVWDVKGDRAGDPIPVPDIPAGPEKHNYRHAWLSPDGKFLAVGRRGLGPSPEPLPLRLFDTATRKAVLSLDWTGGSVYFTADSARVLVAEAGRCRWFKLPSGEPDGEWQVPKSVRLAGPVTALSADGTRVGYSGTPIFPDRSPVAVLDGKTGAVLRGFGEEYQYSSPVSLSADGKLAAVMRKPPGFGSEYTVDVVAVADGRVVGRVTVETLRRSVPTFRLTADGRALVVHDYSGRKLYWYDLPEEK